MVINIVLAVLMIIAQFVDVFTTFRIIDNELGHEGNPAMAWMLDRFGKIGLVLPKFGVILLVSFCFHYVPNVQLLTVMLVLLNVKYIHIITRNLFILRR